MVNNMDYQYTDAYRIAADLAARLEPACEKLDIAGSLRRRKPHVHDIEIICQPRLEHITDLFGNHLDDYTPDLDAILHQLTEDGLLEPLKGAQRYRQFTVRPLGIKLDLFCVLPPAQYGYLYAIRTGPAHYSHWLVTKRQSGGALPSDLTARDGAIWDLAGNIVETPDEETFFALLGIDPVPDPTDRQPAWRKQPAG